MYSRNPLKNSEALLERLIAERQELIAQRIRLEYEIIGVSNYIIYPGNSYCEKTYQKLYKTLTAAEKAIYYQRISKVNAMSKKPYNTYNAMLLQQTKNGIRLITAKIRRIKERVEYLNAEQEKACKNAVFTPRELFGKESYWDLSTDERELYERRNKRSLAEIKLQEKMSKRKQKKY